MVHHNDIEKQYFITFSKVHFVSMCNFQLSFGSNITSKCFT